MKATKWTMKSLATLLVVVGVAMVVVAAGALLSNVLTVKTHVSETVMSQENINTTAYGGSDHQNLSLADGPAARNITYDTGIRTISAVAMNGVIFKFEVTKATTINTTDVTVQYWETQGTPMWVTLPMTVDSGKLVGTFGPSVGFNIPANYDAVTPFLVTFHAKGDYVTTAWLATVA